ncbi:hypothetical protein QQS21_010294 [Conoideocrella luteorostrata]|uniref:Rhodopsin domain-containing protein n=1 Tax=Conoideocrella luteorostrata TaxID=1105319 RepID=A0AAJ0CHN0_9HYPO|nr:hypothetical protein QQS21_010294 [Conoideocrella luteorostrata]
MSSPQTESHPTAVTFYDHGALITITAVVGATWTVLVCIIRLYIRLRLNGPFGLDDVAALFATAVGIAQTAVTLAGVQDGLGKQQDLLSSNQVHSAMKFRRWVAVEILSIFIEFSISAMAIIVVWSLGMALKTKVMVVSAFSAQLLVIVPIIFRLIFVRRLVLMKEATFAPTETIVATQVVLHFSIMAATFPCFRQFLQVFDSGLGATTKIRSETDSGSTTLDSHALQSFPSARARGDRRRGEEVKLRPDSTAEIVTEVASFSREDDVGHEEASRSFDTLGSERAILRTREWRIRFDAYEQGKLGEGRDKLTERGYNATRE